MRPARPIHRVGADACGAAAVEFAFVAPVFLMFVFLLLDGGRMLFTKQALNELAFATARCAAVKNPSCSSEAAAETWAVGRGVQRSQLPLTSDMVKVIPSTACNGQADMAKATIKMQWKSGALMLLPQQLAPTNLVSTACFPVSAT